MVKDNLQKILFQKYQANNLASLYMAKYETISTEPDLWVSEFMAQFTPLEDHPDVLKIKKTDKETEYKVDSLSIKNFIKFLNYRPLDLKTKFIFLFDAHDLSVIVSNKLLKIFEELENHFCLILMVPDNAQLLATVESRAIKLQIPRGARADSSDQELQVFDSIATPMDLTNLMKLQQFDEKLFIEHAIDRLLAKTLASQSSYKTVEATLAALKDNENARNFNNSKISRLTPFFP